jgi:hypothetical protein
VSLVWTDYAGNPLASTQLVNNLDLEVTEPNGSTTYLGNQFSGGWSTTGGTADSVNNVENVYIQSPDTGVWTIEVNGALIPQGPQPYALVVYGQGDLAGPIGLANTAPNLTNPPDQSVATTIGKEQAVDLWDYVTDAEEDHNALQLTIINTPTTNAGITLDYNRYININPTGGWTGTTSVQVQAQDTEGLTDTTTFNVTVIEGRAIYLPLILQEQATPTPTGPTPGYWASTTGDMFYVTSDSAYVDDFAIVVDVTGCGIYKITHDPPEPINNSQFSFSGSFYASGTFNTATTASGSDGLSNFYIGGSCNKYVSGGPWSWNATWQNSSQPKIRSVEIVEPNGVEPANQTGKSGVIVTPITE